MGNKFYEDLNEIPGRHRWVDYARDDFNTAQLEPVWHSWLHHIRQLPPNKDPIVEASHRTWELVSVTLAAYCHIVLPSLQPRERKCIRIDIR